MVHEQRIVFKSTEAIGDLVIASALPVALNALRYPTGIISKAFTLPLWTGLDNVAVYDDVSKVPESAKVVDISDYLSGFPHTRNLPFKYSQTARKGHLCEWMALTASERSGIEFKADRDDVKILLDRRELDFARGEIAKVSRENGNKPVVVIAPYSTTKNKNLSKSVLEKVVDGISGFAVPCLTGHSPEQYIERTASIGNKDLRKASAILYAADACLVVDSAPLHMVNGAIQGERIQGARIRRDNVIVVVGSSEPNVIAYRDNRIISSTGGCASSPCGAHGYLPIAEYSAELRKGFYGTGNDKDKSGCVFKDYAQTPTAKCLEAVKVEEIVQTIKDVVRGR